MKKLLVLMILFIGSISMFAENDSLSVYNTKIESIANALGTSVDVVFESAVDTTHNKEVVTIVTISLVFVLFLIGGLIFRKICIKNGYEGCFDAVGDDHGFGFLGVVCYIITAIFLIVMIVTFPDSIYNINNTAEVVLKRLIGL